MANQKNVVYHTISPEFSNFRQETQETLYTPQPIELGDHPQIARKRGWVGTFILQFFAILWLVPIVALLYLNFSGYIIGASAWCPDGKCYVDAFNPVTAIPERNMLRFDKDSHNLLGALQLVAKALEVWFAVIAAGLVYLITMRFAGKKEGFPIGYLTRPYEFADPVTVFDSLLWTTGPAPYGAQKKVGRRVWFSIALSVGLCGVCNLMGPAVAVLVIPSLQWITTKQVGNRVFSDINAGSPPSTNVNSWYWWATNNCDVDNVQLNAHNYSCSLDPFGYSLDSWIANYFASGDNVQGVTQQNYLTFSANSTFQTSYTNTIQVAVNGYKDVIYWAPSRQIVSNLSTDYQTVGLISAGLNETLINLYDTENVVRADPFDTYTEYNKSLNLAIHRNGPILGTAINMWADYNDTSGWTVEIDSQRQLRCYGNYSLAYTPAARGSSSGDYTKCVRTGSGWSDLNKQANFSVQTYETDTQKSGPLISVNVYSSDQAVFFPNGNYPSWLPKACLGYGSNLNSTTCDWNRLFTPDPTSPVVNRTSNVNTIEFTMTQYDTDIKFVVDFVAYLAFTDYSLDPSPATNPTLLVQTLDLPTSFNAIPVDPTWTLAGWSADAGAPQAPTRESTMWLQTAMDSLLSNATAGDSPQNIPTWTSIDYSALLPVLHTLSLIDHSTEYISNPASYKDTDQTKPLLQRNARMFVWAFDISSRTAYLGSIVAIIGAIVVLTEVCLGFMDRRHIRSPTQLLVAALEHAPKGEFHNKGHDEKAMARVRFHVKDDDGHMGKFSFYDPQDESEIEKR